MQNWYRAFYKWVQQGECFIMREGINRAHGDYIDPSKFYPCLWEWLDDPGDSYKDNMLFTNATDLADRRLIGYRFT